MQMVMPMKFARTDDSSTGSHTTTSLPHSFVSNRGLNVLYSAMIVWLCFVLLVPVALSSHFHVER